MVEEAQRKAEALIDALLPLARAGVPVVGLEPSCLLTLRDETLVMGFGEKAETVAKQALLFEEFVAREVRAGRFELASTAPTTSSRLTPKRRISAGVTSAPAR